MAVELLLDRIAAVPVPWGDARDGAKRHHECEPRMNRPLSCLLTIVLMTALTFVLWRSYTALAQPAQLDSILIALQKYRVRVVQQSGLVP